ncbi:Rieske (2Fe-2S) protein [Halomarina pelagica]|uniref:Rieske (2Fe-2S) protein n=1 Tax=Halomarina pelagica TaxID=2961599 RepID=UPI0020C265D2|nr:Rieske (2Fe-2S) protein [Halomarina sp. BND7]
MGEHVVVSASELSEGDRVVVELEGREVAVFRLDGDLHAYLNWCAHQGGPVCEGALTGTYESSYDREGNEVSLSWCREGEVLMCPWHGWEYDALTGECFSRRSVALPSYPVEEVGGDVVVTL